MRITCIGHASYLVETAGEAVLCDPVLDDEDIAGGLLQSCPARTVDLQRMPAPTAIALSHGHADHFHPPSFAKLPRSTPVVLPALPDLAQRLQALGFHRHLMLEPWESVSLGDVTITATPSEADESPEVGFVFESGGRSFWNMVDCEVSQASRPRLGRLEVVAAKYQPVMVQRQILLGGGSTFDKAEVRGWLESALAVRPALVFPSACGMRYREGPHEWMNRLSFPFTPQDAVRMLRGLAGPGTAVERVVPGDVVHDGRLLPGASPFVRCVADDVSRMAWEPFDPRGLDQAAAGDLEGPLDRFLRERVLPRLDGPFAGFGEWGVVLQICVHDGDRRLWRALDCRVPRLSAGRHPEADYFVHVNGRALLEVLEGRAAPSLFWQGGCARVYEKVMRARDGVLAFPADFFAELPEIFTSLLMQAHRGGLLHA